MTVHVYSDNVHVNYAASYRLATLTDAHGFTRKHIVDKCVCELRLCGLVTEAIDDYRGVRLL